MQKPDDKYSDSGPKWWSAGVRALGLGFASAMLMPCSRRPMQAASSSARAMPLPRWRGATRKQTIAPTVCAFGVD
jgi:hypothetical protein